MSNKPCPKLCIPSMPCHPLQPLGETRLLVSCRPYFTKPHGSHRPRVEVKASWLIRAHRGTVLNYQGELTDCQFLKFTFQRQEGTHRWEKTAEEPLALQAQPGQDGRVYLRAWVPEGKFRGWHTWSRLVCWLWHRFPGLTWGAYQKKGDDDQYEHQANHLNQDPHFTLVDQLEIIGPDGNHQHYMQNPGLHGRKRRAAARRSWRIPQIK